MICKNCEHKIIRRKFTNIYGTTERWLHRNNHSIECQDCAEKGFAERCFFPEPKKTKKEAKKKNE